jgi:hypothetical protein
MRVVASMIIVVLVMAAGASPALAQQGQMGGQGPGPGMGKGMQQEVTPEKFPEFKARELKNIDERMKRMVEHRACIEKAQTHEEMKKCRPEPPMGGGQMPRGSGPQRPPQTGAEGQK